MQNIHSSLYLVTIPVYGSSLEPPTGLTHAVQISAVTFMYNGRLVETKDRLQRSVNVRRLNSDNKYSMNERNQV